MLRLLLPCILILTSVLVTYISAESIKDYQWKEVLPYLNVKHFQEVRPSPFATLNNTLCAEHFQMYMDQIGTSFWALRMFDSSTKFPESTLMGQTVFLGNFNECIEVENVETAVGTFSGQHCLVTLQLNLTAVQTPSTQNVPDIEAFRSRVRNVGGIDLAVASELLGMILTLSYCIPSTCSAKDFEVIFSSFLQDQNIPLKASASEEFCQTNEGKSLATEDWIAVGILAVLLLMIVSSTAYDIIGKGPKKKLLLAFSVCTNGKKLLNTKDSGDTLHAVHGIRFITICWVVLGHRYTMDVGVPSINLLIFPDFMKNAGRLFITNSTLSVDTFFALSGLFVAYIFLKQFRHKSSGFNIPLYYLHRYIRLTPPCAIAILITATLARYVGSGPLLPSVLEERAECCQYYWWTNILYINNYVAVDRMCMDQTWYLAVDMQLFLLSPILLYPLWKWPHKWNILLLGILIIAGVVSPFTISYVTELSANLLTGNPHRPTLGQEELYIATYSRFGPWVIGVAFGYLIYEYKKKDLKLSVTEICAGWILSTVAMLGSVDGIYSFYQPDADKTILESAFYNGLFRNVWAFGVGVTIFLCATGYGGPVNKLLSWKAFIPLSRLTYCVYLTHLSYQIMQASSTRTPIYIDDLTEFPAFIADLIISLVLAVILSLGIEAPAMNLEKFLMGSGRKTKRNDIEETPVQPQEENKNAYTNKLVEDSVAVEEEIHSITEAEKDMRKDSIEQHLIKE